MINERVAELRASDDVIEVERVVTSRIRPGQLTSELALPYGALARLAEVSRFAIDGSLESRLPLGRQLKAVIARAVRWYIANIVVQLNNFASASVVADRSLLAAMEQLVLRVEGLEAAATIDTAASRRPEHPDVR
jgi:hypothetical protein